MIEIVRVTTDNEIEEILSLQKENLKRFISVEEASIEGFVTAEYNFDFLKLMNEACPSIIAKDNNKVVGYALVTLKSIGQKHNLLNSLIESVNSIIFKGQNMKDYNYVLVGQLCVDKQYRGIGLVQQMYNYFKTELQQDFSCCITDVAQDNPRSIKAHLKTGFEIIHTIEYCGDAWEIVLWDWTK